MIMYVFKDNMELEMLFRMLSACLCGLAVGYERTRHQKSAGIRTYIIVAVGAAVFTMVSKYGFLDVLGDGQKVDVSRVACNIVTGVGFLGAGTIFFRGNRIMGLATSAGIWTMAAIGMAIGNGMYIVAGVATGLLVLVQTTLQQPRWIRFGAKIPGKIIVCMDDKMKTLERLEQVLKEHKISISTSHMKRHKDHAVTYTFSVLMPEQTDVMEMVSLIAAIPSVRSIDM